MKYLISYLWSCVCW